MRQDVGCAPHTAKKWWALPTLPDSRGPRDGPKGLTLVELLVSIAITSVLMLAIGSVMLVATHAFPDVNGPANAIIVASEVAEQLATELQYAVSINSRSATMIEFTVADRDTDEVAETIRYEWSGTPGDPLTRQYNAGTAVNVLDSVQEFNLSYDLENIEAAYYLRVVDIKLRTGNEERTSVYTATETFNKPEVTL